MLSNHPNRALTALVATMFCMTGACAEPGRTVSPIDELPLLYAGDVPWAANPDLGQLLAAVRAATTEFHDVDVAFAAGYRPSRAGCESSSLGAMGIHYGHPALLGLVPGPVPSGTDNVIDPLRPEVLLYEPQADGTRRFVGIEYVVYRAAWDAVNSAPPTLLNIPFDQKFGPDAHGHADHYELHVWLWRNNPLGMFAPWNPKVSC